MSYIDSDLTGQGQHFWKKEQRREDKECQTNDQDMANVPSSGCPRALKAPVDKSSDSRVGHPGRIRGMRYNMVISEETRRAECSESIAGESVLPGHVSATIAWIDAPVEVRVIFTCRPQREESICC